MPGARKAKLVAKETIAGAQQMEPRRRHRESGGLSTILSSNIILIWRINLERCVFA